MTWYGRGGGWDWGEQFAGSRVRSLFNPPDKFGHSGWRKDGVAGTLRPSGKVRPTPGDAPVAGRGWSCHLRERHGDRPARAFKRGRAPGGPVALAERPCTAGRHRSAGAGEGLDKPGGDPRLLPAGQQLAMAPRERQPEGRHPGPAQGAEQVRRRVAERVSWGGLPTGNGAAGRRGGAC